MTSRSAPSLFTSFKEPLFNTQLLFAIVTSFLFIASVGTASAKSRAQEIADLEKSIDDIVEKQEEKKRGFKQRVGEPTKETKSTNKKTETGEEKADPTSSHTQKAEVTKKSSNKATKNKGSFKVGNVIYPYSNNRKSPLGINANEVFEQDASIPFVDLFRVATPFHENIRCRAKDKPCLTSAEVEYDKNGWPKNLNGGKAGVFFLRNVALAALPEGDYKVIYEGEGKIEYKQNVELVSRKDGEDTIRFNAREDGFMTAALQIVKSDTDNPVKNIRVIMPGGICDNAPFKHVKDADDCKDAKYLDFKTHYASIIFNPDYLDFMKDFGVIRFMPMSGITRNPDEHWEQRPTMEKATWGGIYGSRGAPIEIQIELANRLKADPWVNVPHGADDDYMREFAKYVLKHLSPELTPHIEYTNEAWNANFIHNEYMQKMGIAEKLDKDAMLAGYNYYSKRSVEFFEIWDDVYDGQIQDGRKRFVRIIGGWDTRPDISGILLAYDDTYKSVDALAIAPYIGGNLRGFRASKTVSDIFELLNDKKSYRSLPQIMEELEKHGDLAKTFGVSLIAYEGGQGLVDWAARDYLKHPNPLFFAANRDSRMSDLYMDLYKEWRGLGADLFVAFSAPRSCNWSGCWGLKEHIRQDLDKAPKLQASIKFMEENERWWDWTKKSQRKQPSSSKVAKYIAKKDPNKPRIVIRPAKGDSKHFHRLENPQALNLLLEGKTWDKRDISGKWQVKWDEENIYLITKVYDKEFSSDSKDPTEDDSVEFFISHNKDDFHFVYKRLSVNKDNKFDGTERVKEGEGIVLEGDKDIKLPYEIKSKFDGYEMSAVIKWKDLGITPAVKKTLRMDVFVNDDDDGGDRDARISWNSEKTNPSSKNMGMILMSGR